MLKEVCHEHAVSASDFRTGPDAGPSAERSFPEPAPRDQSALDDAFRGFGVPETYATGPSIDVRETGKGLEVTAELPGVDEKDVDVTLANGVLMIRGEKKHEREETEEGYHLMERSYGSFSRSIPLPFDVDDKSVSASFDKGVLRITLPKSPEAESHVRKIAVKGGK
jgi:HSP20 family protein